MNDYSLIIRNCFLRDLKSIFDIGIKGNKIVEISKYIEGKGTQELDANGNLVSPGFVDAHTHMDKALTNIGERLPKYNDASYVRDNSIKLGLEYYTSASEEEIKSNVIEHAYMQVQNGTLYTRTHVDVDSVVGTKAIEATLSAKKDLEDIINIQVVAFAQNGFLCDLKSENLIRKSLEMGCDLVGGLDPATRENDIEKSLDIIFNIAKDYNVNIDHHLMDFGTLGIYTLERLSQKMILYNFQNRVAASHSWALGDFQQKKDLINSFSMFKDADLSFITCYPSTPYNFPVKELMEAGIKIACGSDNIRDFWIPFGNADMVEGALIETQRLNMTTNQDMDLIWDMITSEGARVLGIEEDYGIQVGKKANIVVLNALSPQWSIINQREKKYVISNGKIIVKNGALLK